MRRLKINRRVDVYCPATGRPEMARADDRQQMFFCSACGSTDHDIVDDS